MYPIFPAIHLHSLYKSRPNCTASLPKGAPWTAGTRRLHNEPTNSFMLFCPNGLLCRALDTKGSCRLSAKIIWPISKCRQCQPVGSHRQSSPT